MESCEQRCYYIRTAVYGTVNNPVWEGCVAEGHGGNTVGCGLSVCQGALLWALRSLPCRLAPAGLCELECEQELHFFFFLRNSAFNHTLNMVVKFPPVYVHFNFCLFL